MTRSPRTPAYKQGNTPLYTLVTTAFLICATFAAILLENKRFTEVLIALVATTVPSVIAAGFAERASRDIRNGVVAEKALEGSVKALEITGVTETVEQTKRGESTAAALNALTELLESRRERDTLDALLIEHFRKSDKKEEN